MKKQKLAFAVLVFLLVLLAAGCNNKSSGFLLKLEGEEITLEEYSLLAQEHIAAVASQYSQYDPNSPDFWRTRINGTTPLEKLKEYTQADLLKQKGMQILAKEVAAIDDISFSSFLQQRQSFNQGRLLAKEKGEVLQGNAVFSAQQYYSYRQNELNRAVEQAYFNKIGEISNKNLRAYYQEVLSQQTQKSFQAETIFYYWESEKSFDSMKDFFIQAAKAEKNPQKVCDKVQSKTGVKISYIEKTVSTNETTKEDESYDQTILLIRALESGEFSEAVQTQAITGLIYVKNKKALDFGTFEQMKSYITTLYKNDLVQEKIDSRLAEMRLIQGDEYASLSYADISGVQFND